MAQQERPLTIVTFAADAGGSYAGISRFPKAMLSVGLEDKLTDAGYTPSLVDSLPLGSAKWRRYSKNTNGVNAEGDVVEAIHQLKRTVQKSLLPYASSSSNVNPSSIPFHLFLGGDCYMAPGIMSAYAHAFPSLKVGLIYIDAHADAYYPNGPGATGTVGAMALTHLTLRPEALSSMRAFCKPDGSACVSAENLVMYGLCPHIPENSPANLGFLLDQHFRVYTSDAIKTDWKANAHEALAWLEERVDLILIHFDTDVIGCEEFPLGQFSTWTGTSFRSVMESIQVFVASEKVMGLTVAEGNPDRDEELKMTERLVDALVEGLKERPEIVRKV